MKKLVLYIALCLPLLNGCAFFQKEKLPLPVDRVVVDPKLLQPCDALQPLPEEGITDLQVAEHHITLIGMYGTCSLKQDASIRTIRKLANLE